MRIAVLFDGAGGSRLGLEQAGHDCVGVELCPYKHYMSTMTGNGKCVLGDATKFDLSGFDAVWASPPCQKRSMAHFHKPEQVNLDTSYNVDYLSWCLKLDTGILWVENVLTYGDNTWGEKYNANQFLDIPLQNRTRVIGGRYVPPKVYRQYKRFIDGICPTITASEWKACKGPCSQKGDSCCNRRAARFYNRRLTLEECAFHQGIPLDLLEKWKVPPKNWDSTLNQWYIHIYQAIGNAVPPYMSRKFGEVYV